MYVLYSGEYSTYILYLIYGVDTRIYGGDLLLYKV